MILNNDKVGKLIILHINQVISIQKGFLAFINASAIQTVKKAHSFFWNGCEENSIEDAYNDVNLFDASQFKKSR